MEYKIIWIVGILVIAGIVYLIHRIQVRGKLEDAAEAEALAVKEATEQERIAPSPARKVVKTVKAAVKSHHKAQKRGKPRPY